MPEMRDCVGSEEKEIRENGNGKRFDPGFKLFGQTIPVRPSRETEEKMPALDAEFKDDPMALQSTSHDFNKGNASEDSPEGEEEVHQESGNSEGDNNKDGDEENPNKDGSEEKTTLKKPDKLLPCPRCESMDTKFCYYNNYNVNQPRHFCKNCQRYWTAGGTLRNVPVGAGRRKNKHSAASSHYRHIVSSDSGLAVRTDDQEGDHVMIPCALPAPCVRPLKISGSRIQVIPMDVLESGASTGTVLNFGPEGLSKVNGGDSDVSYERAQMEWQGRDEISCGSSGTGSVNGEKEAGHMNPPQPTSQMDHLKAGNMGWPNGAYPPVPFCGSPWSYGWNFGWGGVNGNPAWSGPNWAGVSWPVVPGSYFGSPPAGWGAGPWASGPFSSSSTNSSGVESGSPTLGKHSRERSQSESKTDGCLWVPKTLRIDDPGEAAKSSIWTTLGLGNKPESTITSGGIFKAFQPKTEGSKDSSTKLSPASQVLHANPAAFSRSISFHESN